jgi:hypothetical protein
MKNAMNNQNKLRLFAAISVFFASFLGVAATASACSTSPVIPELGCGNTGASAYAVGTTNSTNIFQSATMTPYSGGWGVTYSGESTTSPQHSMDNSGKTELIAISFAAPVILDSVSIGWVGNTYGQPVDADFSVLALNPGQSSTIAGKTITQLMSAWTLVGDYSNSSTGTVSVNSSNVSSSWWIISAYNAKYSGGSALDSISDYMKILSIACREPENKVPEPGTLLMLGVGLMGMIALRRRQSA